MNKLISTAALAGGLSVAVAGPADAATAYIGGLFGSSPTMSTITGPGGETCPASTCTRLKYDNISTQSAQKVTDAWFATHGAGDVLFAYSEGSVGAEDALLNHPEYAGKLIILGGPGKYDSGNTPFEGGRPVPTTTNAQVTFVTVKGDSVAQPGTPGASLNTHLKGYNGRNFQAETPLSSTVLTPNVTDKVYATTKPGATPGARPSFLASLFKPRTAAPAARSLTISATSSDRAAKRAERRENRTERRAAARRAAS